MNKFKREYSEFLKNETMKLKLHFKCNVYCDEMILLLLYRKIEKRGFRVYAKGLRLIDNYYIESYFDEYSYES